MAQEIGEHRTSSAGLFHLKLEIRKKKKKEYLAIIPGPTLRSQVVRKPNLRKTIRDY